MYLKIAICIRVFTIICIFHFGVIITCKCNQRGNDLMYKILGEADIFPHSMVSEKWINTNNVFDYDCGYSSNDTW